MVSSGGYTTSINKDTPYEAGVEAMGLWKYKRNKPDLATITTVTGKGKTTYLSTTVLIEASNDY